MKLSVIDYQSSAKNRIFYSCFSASLLATAYGLLPTPAYAAVELSGAYAFGSVRSLGELVSYIVPIAFVIAGMMVTFYFLTACFNYINSHGDKNTVTAARQQIEHSIIGLILLIAAFIVVQYLPKALGLEGMKSLFTP